MANIKQNLLELIGNTPLVSLTNICKSMQLEASIIAKLEAFNPGGSVKDRAALALIEAAEKDERLVSGGTIIEPTSGNTGIGLAWVSRLKGYRLILTMPETMSNERKLLLKALGAELHLTAGSEGMKGAIRKAEELCETIPNAIILQQFSNPAYPTIMCQQTAQEIWEDTDGKVAIFVAGVGTGGTISGVGKGLKTHNKAIQIVAVEPEASPILSGGTAGAHKIAGIGAGFVPINYHAGYVDEVVKASNEHAYEMTRLLAKEEGIFAGVSSGAAAWAAIELAKRPENKGKQIVVLLPDTGDRYLSVDGLF